MACFDHQDVECLICGPAPFDIVSEREAYGLPYPSGDVPALWGLPCAPRRA